MNREIRESSQGPRRRAPALIVCTVAALAGGVLAAAVTTAQGPGDYEPSTTTVTTTVTASTSTTTTTGGTGGVVDILIRLNLKGTKGKQKIGKSVKVKVEAKTETQQVRRQAGAIFVAGYGKLALKVKPGGRGKQCRDKPKGKDKLYRLGDDFKTITDGGTTTLKLKIPNSTRKKVGKKIVCKDTKAKARIRVRANDSFGAKGNEKRTVKVKPR